MNNPWAVAVWDNDLEVGVCPGCGAVDAVDHEHEVGLHDCRGDVWRGIAAKEIDPLTRAAEHDDGQSPAEDQHRRLLKAQRAAMKANTYPRKFKAAERLTDARLPGREPDDAP